MKNEPFVLLSSATKGKFTQLSGTTKLNSPIGRGVRGKKTTKCYPLVWGREKNCRSLRDVRRGWKKEWKHQSLSSTSPKKKIKDGGVEEEQQAWMGKGAFTDDCSPVWAAKVRTWTSFISLQGHCPQSEGSCHPALTSPHSDSQPLKIPTSQRHGILWESSRMRAEGESAARLED